MVSVLGLILDLLPALNAVSAASSDLMWWTSDELYQFADEAVKLLARTAAVFAAADFVATSAGVAEYALPSGALWMIQASVNGNAIRPSTVREIEALDPNWQTTPGAAGRWIQDIGLGQVRLYPVPVGIGTLERVCHIERTAISAGNPTLTGAPLPFGGFVLHAMLAAARGKEGDAQMPDVAAHANARVSLYLSVFASYWGATQ
jgi:hypothetical protein